MGRLPYTNFHDMNLDWVLKQIKKAFTPDNPPPYPVKSVNGQTGNVTVTGDTIPITPNNPEKVTDVLRGKQDAPASPGTPGQVLGIGPNQTPVWLNQSGGVASYDELTGKPSVNGVILSGEMEGTDLGLIDAPSVPGTAGQVLGLGPNQTPVWINQQGMSIDFLNTASGAVASFDDGANNMPLVNLLIGIEPVQASGTPSPSNPLPITGWTGCNVTRTGKNLCDPSVKEQTSQTVSQWYASGSGYKLIAGETYVLSSNNSSVTVYFSNFDNTTIVSGSPFAKYTPATDTVCKFRAYLSSGIADIELQLEVFDSSSATASSFTPYVGTTYPITWQTEAGTVYGGTVNPVTGKLIVTDGQIASYNGETLPSTWISDRDVYAEGTTPTIGAQVVYKLAEPLEYDLTPVTITTLFGYNNIFADTGNIIDCFYHADMQKYLDELSRVKILSPSDNTVTLQPFPVTYNFGERANLTITAPSDTYYKFMFKCPSNAITNITINGVPDSAGDVILTAGTTYIVEIWAGIANYTKLALVGG